MFSPDLVVSLGGSCRVTLNMRRWFKVDRAYPFDWWITPTNSLVKMLDPGFSFQVARDDLIVTASPDGKLHNTVINKKLYIQHHHDFIRNSSGQVDVISDDQIDKVNSKYGFLFDRMRSDISNANRVLFVMGGVFNSLGADLNKSMGGGAPFAPSTIPEVAQSLKAFSGKDVFLLSVNVVQSPADVNFYKSDNFASFSLMDNGVRAGLDPSQQYAEPVNVFERAFACCGFNLSGICFGLEDDKAKLTISNNVPMRG